ncbi:MAG: hypothetical protein ACXVRZ_09900, partial [Gaiellaceae bacterium]
MESVNRARKGGCGFDFTFGPGNRSQPAQRFEGRALIADSPIDSKVLVISPLGDFAVASKKTQVAEIPDDERTVPEVTDLPR